MSDIKRDQREVDPKDRERTSRAGDLSPAEAKGLDKDAPKKKARPETPVEGIEQEPEPDAENMIPRKDGPGTF